LQTLVKILATDKQSSLFCRRIKRRGKKFNDADYIVHLCRSNGSQERRQISDDRVRKKIQNPRIAIGYGIGVGDFRQRFGNGLRDDRQPDQDYLRFAARNSDQDIVTAHNLRSGANVIKLSFTSSLTVQNNRLFILVKFFPG